MKLKKVTSIKKDAPSYPSHKDYLCETDSFSRTKKGRSFGKIAVAIATIAATGTVSGTILTGCGEDNKTAGVPAVTTYTEGSRTAGVPSVATCNEGSKTAGVSAVTTCNEGSRTAGVPSVAQPVTPVSSSGNLPVSDDKINDNDVIISNSDKVKLEDKPVVHRLGGKIRMPRAPITSEVDSSSSSDK